MTGSATGVGPTAPRDVGGAGTKSEQTRARLTAAALESLTRHGYRGTTMRGIAGAAGVSLGNAYYHFESKDHLVLAFYVHCQDEHEELVRSRLVGQDELATRLETAWWGGIEVMREQRDLVRELVPVVAAPRSVTSPLGQQSAGLRERAVALYGEVLQSSRRPIPPTLAPVLPELCWFAFLALALFWVHDDSADAARTRDLVHRSAGLVADLVRLARLPVLRGATARVVETFHAVR